MQDDLRRRDAEWRAREQPAMTTATYSRAAMTVRSWQRPRKPSFSHACGQSISFQRGVERARRLERAFATGQEQRESARAEFPTATQLALC
jgi:hypothetical protein